MGSCADDAMYRSLCCVSRVGAREIAINATCCGWGGPPSAVNTSELRRIWDALEESRVNGRLRQEDFIG